MITEPIKEAAKCLELSKQAIDLLMDGINENNPPLKELEKILLHMGESTLEYCDVENPDQDITLLFQLYTGIQIGIIKILATQISTGKIDKTEIKEYLLDSAQDAAAKLISEALNNRKGTNQ